MEKLYIWLIVVIIILVVNYYRDKKTDEEFEIQQEFNKKSILAYQIENREVRTDFEEFNEDEFWKLIEKSSESCKGSYKNQLGLLMDYFRKYSKEELIQLDNLVNRLYREFISQDLLAASYIIFKTSEISATYLLMSIFMTRGRVFYKNACLNPNLIIGKKLNEISDYTIPDAISEIYKRKTDMLIPIPEEQEEFEIKGKKWSERELPSKYSELWLAFA
tara:strand:- start:249 stop:905 length:657 start_codon:yes stop_codon:yes gene_type:complete